VIYNKIKHYGARRNQQAALLLDGFQGSWKKIKKYFYFFWHFFIYI
jgi:hypothetical protein